MSWMAFEKTWLIRLLDAALPWPEGAEPAGGGQAAMEKSLELLLGGMPASQAVLLRLVVWTMVWWSPLWIGSLPTFFRLQAVDRDRILTAMGGSRFYLVREMVVLVKLFAGLLRELDPAYQEAIGWGQGEPVRIEGVGA